MWKTTTRNEQITGYEALRFECDTGVGDHKASIEHQKTLEQEIKLLQEDLKLDKRHTDLREKINILRADIEEEKAGRRAWVVRRTEIDTELASLRSGPLAGTRINGRRPTERPAGDVEPPISSAQDDIVDGPEVDHSSGSSRININMHAH
jgi:hypothetical protein